MNRLASISIDLDGLSHYEALYGLPRESNAEAVVRLAPVRLAELVSEHSCRATFFAIAREIPAGGEPLRALATAGHEIGNHTLEHPYALTRSSTAEIERQVAGGRSAIAASTGYLPIGFRAPGYTLTSALLEAVERSGHRYDSSTFPAAPYYLAKAVVMGALRLRGRPSAAILDRPRVLAAPLAPYRPSRDEPYARGARALVELPMAVDPWLRIPFFGTSVVTLPWSAVRLLYSNVKRLPFLNLELHGVDLLDASDGMAPALARAQRDLAIPAVEKMRRLREVLSWIAADYEIRPLAEVADRLSASV